MTQFVRVSFYEISSCGYFKKKESRPQFGTPNEIFSDFHTWLSEDTPTIRETQTYETSEDSQNLPAYCCDSAHLDSNGDFLFVLWNETQTSNGLFASLGENDSVGTPHIETSEVPENSIPGYPTYFYVVPEKNMVAALRFEQSLTGIRNFNKYFKGYLERFSQWVVIDDEENVTFDTSIVGYRQNSNDEALRLLPRFQTGLKRRAGELEQIRSRRTQIRKIVHKDVFNLSVQKKVGLIQSLLGYLEGTEARINNVPESASFKYEFDFTPSATELNKIIQNWQNATDETEESVWGDIGFNFIGDSRVYWLGQMALKDELNLNITRRADGLYSARTILNALAHRDIRPRLIRKFENG